ncbi:hypothetical protein B0H19DRAFT_1065479 [Mycena capillaripes]|nr:hypothetical protein B0H19DRAFT_1065479 [Mycena capillaripes]
MSDQYTIHGVEMRRKGQEQLKLQQASSKSGVVSGIVGHSINAGLRNFTPTEKFSRIGDPKYHTLLKGPMDSQLKGYIEGLKLKVDTWSVTRKRVFQRDHVCELRFLSIIFMRHAADEAGENIKFTKSAFIWLAEVASDPTNCVWLSQQFHTAKTQYFSQIESFMRVVGVAGLDFQEKAVVTAEYASGGGEECL